MMKDIFLPGMNDWAAPPGLKITAPTIFYRWLGSYGAVSFQFILQQGSIGAFRLKSVRSGHIA